MEPLREAFAFPDARELSPLQLAYLGDTLHDLYARGRLLSRRAPVGELHRRAVRMVSAEAQARMLARIGGTLTPEEADVVRRGRNAQAKHATPRNQDAADYRMATGLEALWGWLFVRGSTERMLELMEIASEGEDALWEKPD